MARNDKWIAKQIKNSDKDLSADVDSNEDRVRLDRLARIHAEQVAELKANPTMAIARISSQKVYFTAEELHLAYGKQMKPKVNAAAADAKPESLTKYDDIATNTDEEFWEDVAQIEGHWTQKR